MIKNILANKLIKYIFFSIILGFSALIVWWLIAAGPDTVWKIITSDTSGIHDYAIFPSRILTASEIPFQFTVSDGEIPEKIRHSEYGVLGFEEFLEETDTSAFLIIKDDAILYEKYGQGYSESTPTLAFSMSKSFLSMLIGAAIDDKYIQSVDELVTDYVPELTEAGYDKVTIGHLLQMTSGMDYVEIEDNPYSLHTRFYYANRLEYELLHLDLAHDPGLEFSYKTGENALLGLILSRALGEKPSPSTPRNVYGSRWVWNSTVPGTLIILVDWKKPGAA